MINDKPTILDLGCGAGAVSMGLHNAGFDVTGLDVVDQPHYPFKFRRADALTADLSGYDAIHASMPCQLWSQSTLGQRRAGRVYPDLITPLRPRLEAAGVPWTMENVPDAPLRPDLELCGCMFKGTRTQTAELRRTRVFEMSWHPAPIRLPHDHRLPSISVCGHGTPAWQRRLTGHVPVAVWRQVMGIDWMNREELTEAVPPVYGQFAGCLLMMRVLTGGQP
jgi:hypothetical protein